MSLPDELTPQEVLDQFMRVLGSMADYFEMPWIPWPDPVFAIRTKPGFIFDDSFWEVFQAFPFMICHVAYYGPARIEDGDRHKDEGVFELRWTNVRIPGSHCCGAGGEIRRSALRSEEER